MRRRTADASYPDLALFRKDLPPFRKDSNAYPSIALLAATAVSMKLVKVATLAGRCS
jgi:hypothetical protein